MLTTGEQKSPVSNDTKVEPVIFVDVNRLGDSINIHSAYGSIALIYRTPYLCCSKKHQLSVVAL